MRIASISNNYGKSYDGIGNFAKAQNENYPDNVICKNYTADCSFEESKLHRILNMGMTCAMRKLIKDMKRESFDVVMLEYPFVEWNPLILLPFAAIGRKLKSVGGKLVLSLHEYSRVNKLRKAVIRTLCRMSDAVLVADTEMKSSISPFANEVFIRPIPTNLYNKEAMELDIAPSVSNYAFFGLVNHSKAFDEMMDAWDVYNKDGNKTLYIMTASFLEDVEKKHRGVKYLYKQDDYTIIRTLRSCAVFIAPIKPEVDNKNTSFKTACISGCLSVGKFCVEFQRLPFVINIPDYTVESFLKAFEQTEKMSAAELAESQKSAEAFGQRFTPQETSGIVCNLLRSLQGGKEC